MCGLVGYYNITKKYNEDEIIASLNRGLDLIAHRGPDGSQIWTNELKTLFLGHTRLSIIDLAGGSQPITSHDGRVSIAINGEFYDYKNIRKKYEKKGYQFKTKSDSEILIPLYLEYGVDAFSKLNGEYSIVLYDQKLDSLFLVRDRFGVKPLYYTKLGNAFIFASEMKAFKGFNFPFKWSEMNVLKNHHLFLLESTDTLFDRIFQVKPGSFIRLDSRGEIKDYNYWQLKFIESIKGSEISINEHIHIVRERMQSSVKRRLEADVPVATYLSGGLDSSAITGIASRQTPLEAFTIRFQDIAYDESDAAKATAEFNNININILDVNSTMIADSFSDALYHSEMTAFNAHGVAKYLLSNYVHKKGYKVVLTGEGADELFGGYAFFVRDMINSFKQGKDKNSLLQALNSSNKVYGSLINKSISDGFEEVNRYLGYLPQFLQISSLFSDNMKSLHSSAFNKFFEKNTDLIEKFVFNQQIPTDIHCLHKTMLMWICSHFPNYILNMVGDRMEMAHSVEGRVPFLDIDLVDAVSMIPSEYKINHGNEKFILKEAMKPFISREVFDKKKQPFVAPIHMFDKGSRLNQFVEANLYSSSLRDIPFYDAGKVQKYYEKMMSASHEDQQNAEKLIFIVLSMVVLAEKFRVS